MAIPEFQAFFLPFLQHISDGTDHSLPETIEALADELSLSAEDRKLLLPSGTTTYLKNRVAWTRSYLKNAGLLSQPSRGVFRITERGRQILASNPVTLRIKHLRQFPEFVEFHKGKKKKDDSQKPDIPTVEVSRRKRSLMTHTRALGKN